MLQFDIHGAIPDEIGDLIFLEELDIYNNMITKLPATIGNLHNLKILEIAYEPLLDSVPEEVGQLTNLEELWFDFTGVKNLPASIGNLTSLKYLDGTASSITGIIPESFGNLIGLEELQLGDNMLEGPLPCGLGYLPNLQHIDIASNNISGCIPSSYINLCGSVFFRSQFNSGLQDFGDFCAGIQCEEHKNLVSAFPDTVACLGSIITLTAPPAPSYQWSTGAITASIDIELQSDTTLSVTLLQASGCSIGDIIDLTAIRPPVVSEIISNASSPAAPDGSIAITLTNGHAPFSFLWSNGSTNEDLLMVTAGDYVLTITDDHTCSSVYNYTVGVSCQPAGTVCDDGDPSTYNDREDGDCQCMGTPCPDLMLHLVTMDLQCHQDFTGTALSTPSGGNEPYSYLWSTGATSAMITALDTGVYSITITDINHCSADTAFRIGQPPVISTYLTAEVESKPGAMDGSASVHISGGTPPFQYSWSTGSDSATASGLEGNITYYVTITDANQCQAVDSVTLQSKCLPPGTSCNDGDDNTYQDQEDGNCHCSGIPCPVIQLATQQRMPSCSGSDDGSIAVTAAAGSPPYMYLWSTGSTGPNLNGVPADIYRLTVTDINECSETFEINLEEPPPLVVTVQEESESSPGASDGKIDVSVVGGTQPYTFIWSTGATSEDLSGLAGGGSVYSVTVSDANHCETTVSTTIHTGCLALGTPCDDHDPGTYDDKENGLCACSGTPCPTLHAGIEIQPVSCFGANDGSICLNPAGGTGPYQAIWSNGTAGLQIENVAAGNYSVTVSDDHGCEEIFGIVMPLPEALSLDLSASAESSPGAMDGAVYTEVTGGTPPYSFAWSQGAQTADLTGLAGDQAYIVTVTDNRQCQITGTIFLATNCLATGTECDDGDSTTIQDQEDGNCLCTGIRCADLKVHVTTVEPTCHSLANGAAVINNQGGAPPYQINWSNGSQNVDSLDSLPAGIYSVTIQDVNGCTWDTTFLLENPDSLFLQLQTQAASGNTALDATIDLTVQGGKAPYSFLWSNGSVSEDLDNLMGNQWLFVTVSDANGCVLTDSIRTNLECLSGSRCDDGNPLTFNDLVNDSCQCAGQPCQRPDINYTLIQPQCNGDTNGSITVSAKSEYHLRWSTGSSSHTLTNLAHGAYTLTIMDTNGCQFYDTVLLDQPAPLMVEKMVDAASFEGVADGQIVLNVNGGNGPYHYRWSNDSTDSIVSMISDEAWFGFTVTDAHGCTVSDSVLHAPDPCHEQIIEESITIEDLTTWDPTDCQSQDGGIEIKAISHLGGTLYYSIDGGGQWVDTARFFSLPQGRFNVLIRHDGTSCALEFVVDLGEPLKTDLSEVEYGAPTACGLEDGYLHLNTNAEKIEYSLDGQAWRSTPTFNALGSGKYQLYVRSAGSECTTLFSKTFDLTRQDDLDVKAVIIEPGSSCPMVQASIAIVTDELYEYSLSDGHWQSQTLFEGLTSASYTLSIRRPEDGCLLQWPDVLVIPQQKDLISSRITWTDPSDCTQNNGRISLEKLAGHNFEFSLNSGGLWTNQPAFDSLMADVYYLLVRDTLEKCTDTLKIELVANTEGKLTSSVQSLSPTCAGGSDGIIQISLDNIAAISFFGPMGPKGACARNYPLASMR